MNPKNNCRNCGEVIPAERLEAIKTLRLNQICIKCAESVKPIHAIYMGEYGTSKMILSDNVGQQSGIYRERFLTQNEDEDDLELTNE